MRIQGTIRAALVAISTVTIPLTVQGLDLSFLDQAPIRFFDDADLKLMGEAADEALDEAEIRHGVDWSNERTGSSGTITPIRSFTRDGHPCRRLEVVSRAQRAARGSATTTLDFCKSEGTWRILTVVR